MSLNTPRDLFEHELLDMYDAEHRLLKSLPQMAEAATDGTLKAGFEKHAQQTEQHVARIEQVCESIGIEAKRETCPGMAGLVKEVEQFLKEGASPEVTNLFLLSAADKTEHYEIVGYKGLIQMAENLGLADAVAPLQETLREEETMDRELESLQTQLGKTLVSAGK